MRDERPAEERARTSPRAIAAAALLVVVAAAFVIIFLAVVFSRACGREDGIRSMALLML